MEKINLSEYLQKGEAFIEAQTFIVNKDCKIGNNDGGVVLKGCTFIYESSGGITFHNCVISNCIFIGLAKPELYGEGHFGHAWFDSTKVDGIILKNSFKIVLFGKCSVKNLTDESYSESFNSSSSQISDFNIRGYCTKIHFKEVTFSSTSSEKSVWKKGIGLTAHCESVAFNDVNIHPYWLAAKCKDKSSLDLTRATLIDDWSRLRKKYAGMSLLIVLILTFLYFLPIFFHAFYLSLASKITIELPSIRKVPLWEVLLYGGKTGYVAGIYAFLTVVLLLYNVGRLYMTVSISRLREEENFLNDSNFPIAAIPPEKYKNQVLLDKILSTLFWISIIYTVFKLFDALFLEVPVLNL